MNERFFLDNLWRDISGLPEITQDSLKLPSLDSLKETEWDSKFEHLMHSRLIMGAIRYGLINAPNKPKYDRCASIRKRLQLFEESGNAEYLVDIANMALLMFAEKQHSNFHFSSVDDGYHDKIIK